jgi:ABC-type glycerol-3-phosphate transport system substrate-binding protein
MKKTLATLLVAGALAAAGLSASAAVSATADNSQQTPVAAPHWWPNSTSKV